ncbi:hypothetical protein [Mycobacterium sp.]|uniref:hypothetical protein n=1 Tax=Mycobacterium sp. TaxID=1785 RepID=UPI002CA9943E|nr:hypothetical protein [Mycobacterium sp.]HME47652.1 hypothetical protein [Mycobacterium sp.]
MTSADREQPDRDEELENIVDQLDENVAGEREAEGVPGKPGNRGDSEQAPVDDSASEESEPSD